MNPVIQKLAEQAGAKFIKNVIVVADQGVSGNASDFIPKFAELIVAECIREIGAKSLELLDTEFCQHYQARLSKRFGVDV